MKEYLALQITMTNRKIKEAGINPVLGYLLGLTLFILVTEYLFYKTEFAKYLIILVCLSFQFRLAKKNRTDFLLSIFGDSTKNKLRVLENLIISFPFILILGYKSLFLEAIILLLCAISIGLFSFHTNLLFTVPTPFSKHPFEFTTGFRKSLILIIMTYVLTIIAIQVDNFNLGVFSMLLIFLITLSYYSKPEEDFYVWVHSQTPHLFLKKKMIIGTKNSVFLTLPIFLTLVIVYPAEYIFIILVVFIGVLFIVTMILAKYAAYPSEINLPEGIIIAFGISLPPILLLILPYFYTKSIKNLKLLLHD